MLILTRQAAGLYTISTSIALADGTNGGLASNYTINDGVFTITKKTISVSGARLYDATTDAVAST